ncbi:MAG: transcriptional regulator [Flavobacterium sp.]|uniref:transcriptional regulator n=1 Tax=Flavobacterium sp. TaxID=239 RepID=UPI0022C02F45|nr:transcriptional regulator [Flavobacterium sp.]MCZ8168827.1 transcriptional regulator [Flavobacterium sp.]MCZ8296754.1 transcriptional regulator [Flavobacterium sp.]
MGIKKAFIQRALDVNQTTISRYFRQHSIQIAILWRFSRILKFNFFMALGEQLQIPYTTQAEKELRNTLHLKNHEIELLQAKVHYLESLLKKT